MDAPPIQYARTDDDVSIAYAVSGSGLPVVRTPAWPFNHIELEWQVEEFHNWYSSLGAKFSLVRYDPRGQGLSQRPVSEIGRETWLRDLEAVTANVQERPFVLMGQVLTSITAIDYAAAHPEDVLALILWAPVAGTEAAAARKAIHSSWKALAASAWENFIRSYVSLPLPWTNASTARAYGDVIRQSTDPQSFLAQLPQFEDALAFDTTSDLYSATTHPTLILYRRESSGAGEARLVASVISGARLQSFDGDVMPPWAGDPQPIVDAIAEFIGGLVPVPHESIAPPVVEHASVPVVTGLTNREVEVIRLVSQGLSNDAIGEQLVISSATVARHVSNILNKTGLSNRVELTRFAGESGLL